jgi:hypothetical protein
MSVREIIDYCVKHYEEDGCDIVVETLTNAEIATLIEGAHTLEDAIDAVLSAVAPIHAHRQEIRSTIW